MVCLYAWLRKDPCRNKKFLANHTPLPPHFSLDSLAAEVYSSLEWWDLLKQLGLYLIPYRNRHTCAAPEANSFALCDDKTVAVGPGATGKTDIKMRGIKHSSCNLVGFTLSYIFFSCRNFYRL